MGVAQIPRRPKVAILGLAMMSSCSAMVRAQDLSELESITAEQALIKIEMNMPKSKRERHWRLGEDRREAYGGAYKYIEVASLQNFSSPSDYVVARYMALPEGGVFDDLLFGSISVLAPGFIGLPQDHPVAMIGDEFSADDEMYLRLPAVDGSQTLVTLTFRDHKCIGFEYFWSTTEYYSPDRMLQGVYCMKVEPALTCAEIARMMSAVKIKNGGGPPLRARGGRSGCSG